VVIELQGKKLKVQSERSHLTRLMDVRITDTKFVEDKRQLATCWPPMGTCASCGMEGYRHLRAPCIAQDWRCNECGSDGHLARACKTKKTWFAEEKGNRTRRKEKTPANRSGLPGGAGVHAQETSCVQGEPRSRHNLGGHKSWTNKRQKTHHEGLSNDKLTMGSSAVCTHPKTDYTPSKDPRVSSMEQGGTTVAIPQRGQNFCHEPVVSGVIQRWETNT
jgi:hypothetical protein